MKRQIEAPRVTHWHEWDAPRNGHMVLAECGAWVDKNACVKNGVTEPTCVTCAERRAAVDALDLDALESNDDDIAIDVARDEA